MKNEAITDEQKDGLRAAGMKVTTAKKKPGSNKVISSNILLKQLEEATARNDEIRAEDAVRDEQIAKLTEAILQAMAKTSDGGISDELMAIITEAEKEVRRLEARGDASDVGVSAGQLKFFNSIAGAPGSNLNWEDIRLFFESGQAQSAIEKSSKDLQGSMRIRVDRNHEVFYSRKESLGIVDGRIADELKRIYQERKEADRYAWESRRNEEQKRDDDLRKKSRGFTYDDLKSGDTGTLRVVVHNQETKRPVGSFGAESDGEHFIVTYPSNERVANILSRERVQERRPNDDIPSCFVKKFVIKDLEPNLDDIREPCLYLVVKLIEKDQEHLKAMYTRRVRGKQEAEEYKKRLEAKSTLTISEVANAINNDAEKKLDGVVFIPIDRFRLDGQGLPLYGGYTFKVKDGKVNVVEMCGTGGKQIPESAFKRSLSLEQFLNNRHSIIRSPMRHQARLANILLPGMKPLEEVQKDVDQTETEEVVQPTSEASETTES